MLKINPEKNGRTDYTPMFDRNWWNLDFAGITRMEAPGVILMWENGLLGDCRAKIQSLRQFGQRNRLTTQIMTIRALEHGEHARRILARFQTREEYWTRQEERFKMT